MHRLHEQILNGLRTGELKPRYHNGIGFAQMYLADEVRLHVWHPDFPNTPESFGTRHNHRFDFLSTVLKGSMTNITLDILHDEDGGPFDLYTVQPAHLGAATPILKAPNVGAAITKIEVVQAGESYTFQKGVYHEGRANGITATVLKKLNQEDAWAGILAYSGQQPEHGMERETISKEKLNGMLIDVINSFDGTAWANIEGMLR